MVDVASLQKIFPLTDDKQKCEVEYYNSARAAYKELLKLGHHLWLFPINKIADLIVLLNPLSPVISKQAIIAIAYYVYRIPYFNANDLQKTMSDYKQFLSKTVDEYILSEPKGQKLIRSAHELSTRDVLDCKSIILNILYSYICNMRHTLAPQIIAASESVQPQVMPTYSHPVYKLYTEVDIEGGSVIGNGTDSEYSKSLISSNDIAGLLVKLKTVYMRASYLQLIQTLRQLAEKKSYQVVTFRQDELTAVIEQIKKLSADTYRQLKLEDELISKMCYNIIKIIDPTADMEKTMEALSLDIGLYPANAYALEHRAFL